MSLIIEELKESVIDSNVKFAFSDFEPQEILRTRKSNKNITTMIWITLRPVICSYAVYNPKALILQFLN